MPKIDAPINELEQFLPANVYPKIAPYFKEYKIHLTITQDRTTVLGDYRRPTREYPVHRISINGNLNRYSFLITLLHELAHLQAYVLYKNTIQPHGAEWKKIYRKILSKFIGKNFFPPSLENVIIEHLSDITAATCSDPNLYLALKQFDKKRKYARLVNELSIHQKFRTKDGRIFQVTEKLRTRYRCKELKTGLIYIFPGLAEVIIIPENELAGVIPI